LRRVSVGTWRPKQPDAAPRELNTAAGVPVALTCNRDSHVVMIATPPDLQERALKLAGRAVKWSTRLLRPPSTYWWRFPSPSRWR